MRRINILSALVFSLFMFMGPVPSEAANPCNPCAKNACNPCAKNPCNPCSDTSSIPIRSQHITSQKKLVAMGEKLWNDETLGESGFSCMTCHDDYEKLNLEKHHGVWPHAVHMTNDIVTFTQMLNYCMMNPMEGKQIDSNSIKVTAFQAYYRDYIKSFKPDDNENPCGKKMRKNPCNPCGR